MSQDYHSSRLFEDSTNLFLIVLKFLLVMVIGLQGSLKQLGFDPSDRRGIVNATPASQVTSSPNGIFQVSFYSVFYSAGSPSKAHEFNHTVTPWRCEGACSLEGLDGETCWETSGGASANAGWVPLASDSFTPDELDRQRSPLRQRLFDLRRGPTDDRFVTGKYSMVYHVKLLHLESDDETDAFNECILSDDGSPFGVVYQPNDEGEWRLPPIELVQGRTAELPTELSGLQVSVDPSTGLKLTSGRMDVTDR